LRHKATARVATVDALITATAAYRGAILVHRDPHFAALPVGRPMQETLPDKD
jgi:predicted nucleic acid-binding protein